jgi:hypothetical protein
VRPPGSPTPAIRRLAVTAPRKQSRPCSEPYHRANAATPVRAPSAGRGCHRCNGRWPRGCLGGNVWSLAAARPATCRRACCGVGPRLPRSGRPGWSAGRASR